MAVVVVNEVELGIVDFRGPLERVCGNGGAGGRSRRDGSERRVIVSRGDIAGGVDQLADIFREVNRREVKSVAGDVDSKRTRRRRFRRVPVDDVFERVV